jgi:hypothetical protein
MAEAYVWCGRRLAEAAPEDKEARSWAAAEVIAMAPDGVSRALNDDEPFCRRRLLPLDPGHGDRRRESLRSRLTLRLRPSANNVR